MARSKIGIDVDEVCTNFITPFRREAESVLGRSFPHKSTSWGFEDWGLTKEDKAKVWEAINATENWFYLFDSEPLPGVVHTLPWLTEEHDCYFITSRRNTKGMSVMRQTQMTLCDLGVEYPNVIVTDVKGPVVKALELVAFVDDKPENLQNIAEYSPDTKLFLMNQGQNSNFIAPHKWLRVNNLESFARNL